MGRDWGKPSCLLSHFYNKLVSNALRILNEFSCLQNAQHFLKGCGGWGHEMPVKRQKMGVGREGEREMHRLIRKKNENPLGRWGNHFVGGLFLSQTGTKLGPQRCQRRGQVTIGRKCSARWVWGGQPLPPPGEQATGCLDGCASTTKKFFLHTHPGFLWLSPQWRGRAPAHDFPG